MLRMSILSEQRADLDLQINVLAVHEITSVLVLVNAMADAMGIVGARDKETSEPERHIRTATRGQGASAS